PYRGGGRGHHRDPAPRPLYGQRQGDGETGEQDHELPEVDPRRREKAARGEIGGHHEAAHEAARPLRHAGHDVQDPRERDELAREYGQRAEPQQDGDQPAHTAVVAMLEVVAHGAQVAGLGEPADPGYYGEVVDEGPDPGRAHPPPG